MQNPKIPPKNSRNSLYPPKTTKNCLDPPKNTEKILYPTKNEGPTPFLTPTLSPNFNSKMSKLIG